MDGRAAHWALWGAGYVRGLGKTWGRAAPAACSPEGLTLGRDRFSDHGLPGVSGVKGDLRRSSVLCRLGDTFTDLSCSYASGSWVPKLSRRKCMPAQSTPGQGFSSMLWECPIFPVPQFTTPSSCNYHTPWQVEGRLGLEEQTDHSIQECRFRDVCSWK